MRLRKQTFLLLLLNIVFSISVFAKGSSILHENPFNPVFSDGGLKLFGDFVSTGDSVLCQNNGSGGCNNTYSGYLYDTNLIYKNEAGMALNSASSSLTLPTNIGGNEIEWAGLYWQGHIADPDATNYATSSMVQNRGNVSFQLPDGTTQNITADKVWHHDFWGDGTGNDGGFRSFYQGFKDVTSLVKSHLIGGTTQTFSVGNIKANNGTDWYSYFYLGEGAEYNGLKIGFWGNWSLIVVYKHNPATIPSGTKIKNINVFNGFDAMFPLPITGYETFNISIPMSGFLTPKSGTVNAKMLFYASGGEKAIQRDAFYIQNANNSYNYEAVSNDANPGNNPFNGSVSDFGVPIDAAISYYPGLDLDTYDVSSYMTNNQTSTALKLEAIFSSSNGDQSTPGVIAFSTDLYTPEFCYDYAYKQQGIYFTEENDGTQYPRIVGDVIPNEPIEAKFFIRNLVDSDIAVTDMLVDIYDINTSQATYVANSTKLAKIGDISPVDLIDGTDISIGGDYINNVNVGSIDSQEHFYVYYSLDPSTSNIDIPLNVRANYNITHNGVTIPYELTLGAQVPLCTNSGFVYTPQKGIFNVVHNDYYNYDVGGANRYYNLPTQVTKREGNFKVVAMDPSNLDTPSGVSTIVAVEMIDASAFHDTEASCKEMSSSISPKVWVFFENNATSSMFNKDAIDNSIALNMTQLNNSSDFYTYSRENAAFRISYNSNPETDDIFKVTPGKKAGTYDVDFPALIDYYGTSCSQTIVYDKDKDKTTDQLPVACGNNSDLTAEQVQACMECIFGYKTKLTCSRDNFTLRPEAFMIKVDDQEQTNPASQVRIADNVSGVVTPSAATNHLAAGYNYELEVYAVNHKDNTPSFGYTKGFGGLASDALEYAWSPSVAVSGCNDENNVSHSFRVLNGSADLNSSLDQVGEYVLQMKDTTWTSVDGDFTYMGHHVGPYYTATRDCILGSDITQAVDYATGSATPFTGCNITSDHDSSNASALKYRNYNLEFHPYKFIMNGIGVSFGENNSSVPFIYMNNMSLNENMSFHLNGPITAAGYNNVATSNFVDGCYAEPVDLTLNKSAISGAVDYLFRFHNTDLPANDQNGTMNNPAGTITLGTNDFNQSNNGSANTLLNLNFNREVNASVNPERLFFSTYDSNCSVIADCTMNADLIANKVADGSRLLDLNVTHLYGRTHASRQRYNTPLNNQANIYFESFCFGTVGGNACDKTLLPNGIASRRVDDVRWFINDDHNITNDGSVGIVLQKGGANIAGDIVDASDNPIGNPSITILDYDASRGYPYKTTMQNEASPWLIYNESDPNANTNEFQVEFHNQGDWTGDNVTETTTNTPTDKATTNRRIMW
jgi:hypothetical protein